MTTQAERQPQPTRILYYGDNLEVLRNRQWFPDACVDLVYLDPPFKSQQDYNLLFKTEKGTPAAAQVQAFTDTWKWDTAAVAAYERLVSDPLAPGRVAQMVQAFYQFLGGSEMMAYLVMMTPRLLELHRVLKPTGALYLHCDPAASHYLKLVLDSVFGAQNFRNEIVWQRTSAHSGAKRYGPNFDTLLFYTKSDNYTWNGVKVPHKAEYVERFYRHKDERGRFRLSDLTAAGIRNGASGAPWKAVNPTAVGRHWAVPTEAVKGVLGDKDASKLSTQEKLDLLDKAGRIAWPPGGGVPAYKRYWSEVEDGQSIQAIWNDISPMGAQADERLGYQTQKPLALLRRIIAASTKPGDVVLDPFCGCGTAVVAAEELGRSWVGIDITYLAVDVMARRLRDHFPHIQFEVRGQPRDVEGALALAQKDRFQFQFWALSLVGAQAVVPDRRGPDRGIDGYLPYHAGSEVERAIVSVKSGGVGVRDVRDLRGTMEREKADCGLLITLAPPTRDMHRDAVDAGTHQPPGAGGPVPRIEIVTIEELLRGRKPALAPYSPGPIAQAPRLRRRGGRQAAFGAGGDEDTPA